MQWQYLFRRKTHYRWKFQSFCYYRSSQFHHNFSEHLLHWTWGLSWLIKSLPNKFFFFSTLFLVQMCQSKACSPTVQQLQSYNLSCVGIFWWNRVLLFLPWAECFAFALRGQFHKHLFISSFFIQKCLVQLFCTYAVCVCNLLVKGNWQKSCP